MLFLRYTRIELIKLLGIKESEYYALKKQNNLVSGIEFLKGISGIALIDIWTSFKSRGEMARFFKVSPSFLDSVFKKAFASRVDYMKVQANSAEEMKKLLGLYGSKSIVAKLMGISGGEFNTLCKKYGIKHSDLSTVKSGMESSKGLAAEKEFEKLREGHIIQNMNELDPCAPYDYVDDEFGKVNVKASKAYYSRRHSDRYAKFNFNGGCDTYALFCYDDDFKKILFYFFVAASDYPNKTTVFYHKKLRLPSFIEQEKLAFLERRRAIKK